MSGAPVVLAIDIGGTKLAAARVDADGRVLRREQVATPSGGDAEGLWRAVVAVARRALDGNAPDGVGAGCGGPMEWPRGVVSPVNIAGWRDFPLRDRLREEWPGVPVRVHNDAVCLAVGEHWRGAGRRSRSFLGMVVSTGVGGGLLLDGRLVDGPTGNAGHVGHVVVDPDGPVCGCGGRGCLEAVARGPAVAAWAAAHGWTGGDGSARQLAVDAARGHQVAVAALARAGDALGAALASTASLLDLDAVAIGGGLALAGPLLFGPLQQAFDRHARLGFARRCRVGAAALGQDAGLVGAAALVLGGDPYWAAD